MQSDFQMEHGAWSICRTVKLHAAATECAMADTAA
jgi:hypothetical protein